MDRTSANSSVDVLDDVHKVEEEIDRFLRQNSEKAENLLGEARERAKEIQEEGERDILEEAARLRERLQAEAKKRAGDIERQGEVDARMEVERLNGLREEVVAAILHFVRADS